MSNPFSQFKPYAKRMFLTTRLRPAPNPYCLPSVAFLDPEHLFFSHPHSFIHSHHTYPLSSRSKPTQPQLTMTTIPQSDPTSTWPFFSNWLDDHIDLSTAPQQYTIYAAWAIGLGWTLWGAARYRKLASLVPNSVVSDMNKHHLLDSLKTQRAKGIVYPLAITLAMGWIASTRRNEEVDRSGERFQDYYTRALYAGVEAGIASSMAREIVLSSTTHAEGGMLCDLALERLLLNGVIQPPRYNDSGVYVLPEAVQQANTLQNLEHGATISPSVVIPGETKPIPNPVRETTFDAAV